MIRAYPGDPALVAGEALRLHVSTDAREFRVRLLRWGDPVPDAIPARGSFRGEDVAPGNAGKAWNWPEYALEIPAQLRAGVYAALLDTETGTFEDFDAREARALFVVRSARPRAALLVVLPLFTYQAYNIAHVDGTAGEDEGESLYSGAPWVTLHRPGGGNGGHPWDEVNADAYDKTSPRQTFAHWDGKALAWLERNGFAYDCCTDAELHDGSIDLHAYRAVASFGHHEYWSDAMRTRVEGYVARGGNAAFFGGNTCWFRVEYDDAERAIRRAGRWADHPEWRFTGASYAYGGGKWIGERPPSGFTVREPQHWLFAGTGLRACEVFGAQERLVGYECDGAPPQSDLLVAADAGIGHWPVDDGSGEVTTSARASLGVRNVNGIVFTASTADWARVLESGNPVVERITRNVLERFCA